MFDTRAGALVTSDFSFFAMPPKRTQRSTRRTDGEAGAARTLIRSIRRELTRATEEPGLNVLPRISNYPY
jgi:hypothetical protein